MTNGWPLLILQIEDTTQFFLVLNFLVNEKKIIKKIGCNSGF